jgi:hypothetical protein
MLGYLSAIRPAETGAPLQCAVILFALTTEGSSVRRIFCAVFARAKRRQR